MRPHTSSSRSGARRTLAAIALSAGILLVNLPPTAARVDRAQPTVDISGAAVAGVFRGTVVADGTPVRNASIRLMRAGRTPGAAQLLRETATDASGSFLLRVPGSVGDGAVLYVTARGGRIGDRQLPSQVQLATSLADRRGGQV